MEDLIHKISLNPNLSIVAVIVAIVVIILTILVLRLWARKSSLRKCVLIMGLSDSGKTLMFSQLAAKKFVSTVTSMTSNECSLRVGNKSLYLIDLPGYERLRMKYWDDHRQRAKGVIIVIDSGVFMSNLRDVADLIYTILVDDHINGRKIPILIACNKQDEAKAKSMKVIQNQLEKEISAIRESRRGALSTTGDDDHRVILGRIDREFSFADLKIPLEFAECSALGTKGQDDDSEYVANLKSVWNWINKIA